MKIVLASVEIQVNYKTVGKNMIVGRGEDRILTNRNFF